MTLCRLHRMYGILEGQPFQVFARRDASGVNLVIRFECKEGMGILGIRKVGREDPSPSAIYEEEEIEPGSLRAGRFVHVLSTGQRQSYALSRISSEVAGRLPTDAWVELKPQTEYGFRYLVAPEEDLIDGGLSPAAVVVDPEAARRTPPQPERGPPPAKPAPCPPPVAPPAQAPMNPGLAEATLKGLSREQAIDYLRIEM
ncbi:MAG TPA: hypothetical protein ENK18_08895, partial [Deltaproteobacteria bacterium]|nr:hypothetical protein [Deltaproteobacteria bacterium]